ncbi:MAG: lamin tail domain-containing protein [Verrucomicrobiota bacterium]|nr:lamin tail domain-containing protein [Verrucomicrobiota bacterium]
MFKHSSSPFRILIHCWMLSFFTTGLADPYISEFMADQDQLLADDDGVFPDWIEIHNPDQQAVSLEGYYLTDSEDEPSQWMFPSVTLDPGSHIVVFASGKDRRDPGLPLHTNFLLAGQGEYLALVHPDGQTVVSAFGPAYPPQFENESFGSMPSTGLRAWTFFSSPTPGAPNRAGVEAGPVMVVEAMDPTQPEAGPLARTVKLRAVNAAVSTVTLFYRKMYEAEIEIPMRDHGRDGDREAGDGIWTSVIPGNAFSPAEMTRWRFVATDAVGNETRAPAFRNRRDSPHYFGTVPKDPDIQSLLPVIHWFTRSPSGAGTNNGSRGSVYYQGEFYDNVHFSLHGQSSAGFPKKSYNIDFNRTHRFRWNEKAPRVADIDLITNWADKSKVRHVLAYEVMRESGVAAHFAYTVRVQQNGGFFSTADMIEDADERYLDRAGLNPEGALYKIYSNTLNKDAGDRATEGVEKKTRLHEKNDDLQALIEGLDLRGTRLERYLYDNIDIPSCVNLLAANSVIRNIDMHSKNWYIYRDTGRSDAWAILPWDLDLSHGRVWNRQNTYFDNQLYTDGFVVNGTAIRLVERMFGNPRMRAMILRRIRTLSDRFLQPSPLTGTPEDDLYYERRLRALSALIDPPSIVPSDARLDFEKWGSWVQGGRKVKHTSRDPAVESMAEALERWKSEYLPARRAFIYDRQIVGRGGQIPLPQISGGPSTNFFPMVVAGATARVHVPLNGNLGTSWTGHPSQEPFNAGGWRRGPTGIGYDRGSAYDALIGLDVANEMHQNTSLYIRIEFEVVDPGAADLMELRMKYDDGFVAYLNGELLVASNAPSTPTWNASARLAHSAHPRRFNRFDLAEKRTHLRPGPNVLAIHALNDSLESKDMLIVPELYLGKISEPTTLEPVLHFGSIESSPASGNQDEEYVEIINRHDIAVDISKWQLAGGVQYVFAPGTVLPPNASLYVSPDPVAFRRRAISPKGGESLFVHGGYRGHLSSRGETLTLLDPEGRINQNTTYAGNPSDVQRYLTISELNYHPHGNPLAEYIELLNLSSSVSLNLEGVRFTRGVAFDFTGSSMRLLGPGERVLIVRDREAFNASHGVDHPVAGVFADGSALSNGGERIKIEDAGNGTVMEFVYDDRAPWPIEPDQSGHSLVLVAPHLHPDPDQAGSWRASSRPGGSPGRQEEGGIPENPSGDLNGNDEPDLIDYALGNDLGLSPVHPSFRWEKHGPGEAELLLVVPFSLRAGDILIEPLFSTDLTDWQDGAPHLEWVAMEPLDGGRSLKVWRVMAPLHDQPRLFMRLRVSSR